MDYADAGEVRIPKLGLGTWQNTGATCTETVQTALELGYRHIDTAQIYDNERAVGAGIEAASVDRGEVFLTTKVWRSNLRYDAVIDSVHDSLERLDTDYVDLLLIHWPHPRISVEESLDAMTDLQAEGVVEHIGVSNFTSSQLRNAIDVAEGPVVTDQVLYHPFKDQSALRSFCVEHGLALTAYSPLARGDVIGHDVLARIGDRYDKTAPQVALRWLIQQEGVVAIPKTTSRDHLEENLVVFDFSLTEAEMAQIHDLQGSLRRRVQDALPGLMRRLPF
ncbi:MAG: aldo/keto reductase [Halobacteriales archaeon]